MGKDGKLIVNNLNPDRHLIGFGVLGFALLLLSCTDAHHNEKENMKIELSREELIELTQARVYFGHQSVGSNILEGLKEVLQDMNGPQLSFVTLKDSVPPRGPWFFDEYIGQNSLPLTKCDAFAGRVRRLSDSLDIAVMKFCYVDVTEHTNVDELFAYYAKTIQGLKKASPRVTFVHSTVPLTQRGEGWKRIVRKIIGRGEAEDCDNLKRAEFNRLIVQTYKDEPIFDLAAIESTYPDGTRNAFEIDGKTGYSMVAEYTNDGGHLTPLGRQLAAREMLRTLVQVTRKHLER